MKLPAPCEPIAARKSTEKTLLSAVARTALGSSLADDAASKIDSTVTAVTAFSMERKGIGMSGQEPSYLGIQGTADGDGWRILVFDDPQGELDKVQARLDAGEVFASVTVTTSRIGSTRKVTFESPVASCRLLPPQPTVIKGTVTPQGVGDRYTFTPKSQ